MAETTASEGLTNLKPVRSYSDFINEQAKGKKDYSTLMNEPFRDCNVVPDLPSKGKTPMETDHERQARTGLSSLQIADAEAQAAQKTPNRVALADIESAIRHIEYINPIIMPHLTIAVVYLENGWAEVGKSAPADEGNFDPELGKKFAREDAIRKLWPLFGFHLRETLRRRGEAQTGSRPFNPTSEADEVANMKARKSAQQVDEEG